MFSDHNKRGQTLVDRYFELKGSFVTKIYIFIFDKSNENHVSTKESKP